MESDKKAGNVDIRFVSAWPQEEIVALYRAGGWWKDAYAPSGIMHVIEGSFAFAVAVVSSSGTAVGMGRVLSDGTSDAYIQDVVVLPEYRAQGIGRRLVKALLEYCVSKGLQWVGLIAEPGQDEFYSLLGFKRMEQYVPMLYQTED
jgi:ribosomal protein S18 acetylase RimI-like enzyme